MTGEAAGAACPPIALLCGGGSFPLAVARSATESGRSVVLFPIRGFADPEAFGGSGYPCEWVHLGSIGKLLAALRRHGCRQVVVVGYVFRPHLRDIRLDWTTIRLLPRLLGAFRGGDNHLLTHLVALLEERGLELLGAHQVAPDILVPAGTLGRVPMEASSLVDARYGLGVVRALGPFDVGQGVVVARRHVQAVEAAEGTDEMLQRCRALRESGRVKLPARTGVLIKARKPGQDLRVDLPSIGRRTVELAAEAGLAGIAVEAGGVMAVEAEAMVEAADEAGLFLVGLAE